MSESIRADYVIVGGGSAGCVLANRLSANPGTRVLLLEAGGRDNAFMVQMPAGMAKLISNPRADWCYMGEPDASIRGRRFLWSAGKLLGGGSSINGQVYIRGLRSDYDRWAAAGCSGWSFEEVLPYFRRGERFEGESAPASHGREGELSVSRIRTPHPLSASFLQSCSARGLPKLDDYCGGEQFGAFETLATQREGLRCSSAKAFLAEVLKRPNLQVMTGCEVQQVLLHEGRASGVRVRRGDRTFDVHCDAEVLVCAGTIGSPLLLLRSGIGEGDHLASVGIALKVEAPEVGMNLQEHPAAAISKRVSVPTYNSLNPLQIGAELLRFLISRRGMMTTPAVQAMAFAKTRAELADPDVQLHFLPLCYEVTPDTLCSATAEMPRHPAMMIMVNVCRPHSRGLLRLRDASPSSAPVIRHQLIGDDRDIATLAGGLRVAENIFGAEPLSKVITGNVAPQRLPEDDEGWADFIRDKTIACYHPVGTCRMGDDPRAVTDPMLRVRGVDRLRVVDASVMPCIPSANTNAATMMIAEKAASLIAAHN